MFEGNIRSHTFLEPGYNMMKHFFFVTGAPGPWNLYYKLLIGVNNSAGKFDLYWPLLTLANVRTTLSGSKHSCQSISDANTKFCNTVTRVNVIKHFFFVTGVPSLVISLNFRKNFFHYKSVSLQTSWAIRLKPPLLL
jgi:hypothetical protein